MYFQDQHITNRIISLHLPFTASRVSAAHIHIQLGTGAAEAEIRMFGIG